MKQWATTQAVTLRASHFHPLLSLQLLDLEGFFPLVPYLPIVLLFVNSLFKSFKFTYSWAFPHTKADSRPANFELPIVLSFLGSSLVSASVTTGWKQLLLKWSISYASLSKYTKVLEAVTSRQNFQTLHHLYLCSEPSALPFYLFASSSILSIPVTPSWTQWGRDGVTTAEANGWQLPVSAPCSHPLYRRTVLTHVAAASHLKCASSKPARGTAFQNCPFPHHRLLLTDVYY